MIFLLLPEVEVLDLAGPLQAFSEAKRYRTRLCSTRERIHRSRTTHLAKRFPNTRVLDDRLFVTDGNITTSAGIASGIDMALALIEQMDRSSP
ncbi:MAG: hypothetical protein ACXW31_10095, partial [Thermoanaerobaculia bacterium]